MMIFWTILIGVPLFAFGAASLVSRERVLRFASWFSSSRMVALFMTAIAWIWATYEIMTFGANMFREFFVGVPVISQVMMAFAFLHDNFWLLTPILIYLTFIWMPKSLAVRALTGILMLMPTGFFKVARFNFPDEGFAPIQIICGTLYLGAIIGMYGMFYPWNLEKSFKIVLSRKWPTIFLGSFCSLLGLTVLVIGFSV